MMMGDMSQMQGDGGMPNWYGMPGGGMYGPSRGMYGPRRGMPSQQDTLTAQAAQPTAQSAGDGTQSTQGVQADGATQPPTPPQPPQGGQGGQGGRSPFNRMAGYGGASMAQQAQGAPQPLPNFMQMMQQRSRGNMSPYGAPYGGRNMPAYMGYGGGMQGGVAQSPYNSSQGYSVPWNMMAY